MQNACEPISAKQIQDPGLYWVRNKKGGDWFPIEFNVIGKPYTTDNVAWEAYEFIKVLKPQQVSELISKGVAS